jgi:chromosome segregation ATPase
MERVKEVEELCEEKTALTAGYGGKDKKRQAIIKKLQEDLDMKNNSEKVETEKARQFKNQIDKQKNDNDKLRTELIEKNETIFEFENEAALKNRHKHDKREKQNWDQEIDNLLQENASLKNKFYEQERETKILDEKISELRGDHKDTLEICDDLKFQISTLHTEKKDLELQSESLRESYDLLISKNSDIGNFTELNELRIREQELVIKVKMLDTELGQMKHQYKDFSGRMEHIYGDSQHRVEAENSTLKKSQKQYLSKIEQLNLQLRAFSDEIRILNTEKEHLKMAGPAELRISELETEISYFRKEQAGHVLLKEQYDSLLDNIMQLKHDKNELGEQFGKKFRDMDHALTEKEKYIDELGKDCSES